MIFLFGWSKLSLENKLNFWLIWLPSRICLHIKKNVIVLVEHFDRWFILNHYINLWIVGYFTSNPYPSQQLLEITLATALTLHLLLWWEREWENNLVMHFFSNFFVHSFFLPAYHRSSLLKAFITFSSLVDFFFLRWPPTKRW